MTFDLCPGRIILVIERPKEAMFVKVKSVDIRTARSDKTKLDAIFVRAKRNVCGQFAFQEVWGKL